MDKINSLQNVHVKAWKKLQSKKGRREYGLYLLDGWHLVNEAVKSHVAIKQLLITGKQLANDPDLTKFPAIIEISEEVAKHISDTVNPQGVFALVPVTAQQLIEPADVTGAWLMLDNVQDPGNIGTMVRTADAAGFQGVVFGAGTADVHQPKVERGMQGSQFHLKLTTGDLNEWIKSFKERSVPVYGTELNPQAINYRAVKPSAQIGIIMGNEGNGMHQELLAQTTNNLYIPLKGAAESLNVAIAAGILMFSLYAD